MLYMSVVGWHPITTTAPYNLYKYYFSWNYLLKLMHIHYRFIGITLIWHQNYYDFITLSEFIYLEKGICACINNRRANASISLTWQFLVIYFRVRFTAIVSILNAGIKKRAKRVDDEWRANLIQSNRKKINSNGNCHTQEVKIWKQNKIAIERHKYEYVPIN